MKQNNNKTAMKFNQGWKKELDMFQFNSVESLEQFVVGSDADVGGIITSFSFSFLSECVLYLITCDIFIRIIRGVLGSHT